MWKPGLNDLVLSTELRAYEIKTRKLKIVLGHPYDNFQLYKIYYNLHSLGASVVYVQLSMAYDLYGKGFTRK